jgi:hypothetical protein
MINDRRQSLPSLFNTSSNKAKYIYSHLDNLTANNLSFNDCCKPKYRLYSSLNPIIRNTLIKYHSALSKEVANVIKYSLPAFIGLIIDGWLGANRLFFVVYMHNL